MHGRDDPGFLYFFHIPKTAGTSLYHWFLRAGGSEGASPPLLWDTLVSGAYQIDEKTRFVSGHLGGLLPLWLGRWPRIVTMLREPAERALSHINHIQREKIHPLHHLAVDRNICQYCEHPVLRKTVDNFQARYLASLAFSLALLPRRGSASEDRPFGKTAIQFEEALHSLDRETGLLDAAVDGLNALDAVGICEVYPQSLQVFASVLGWEMPASEFGDARLNVAGRDQRTLAALSKEETEALNRLNEVDRAVYERGRERFEAFCKERGIQLEDRCMKRVA